MNHRVMVEACVTTLAEAIEAEGAGAGRLELCRELETGGLTPSADLLSMVRSRVGIPVFAMIRVTGGHFRVSPARAEVMAGQMRDLAEAGAQGFVLGVLDRSDSIDPEALTMLMTAAEGLPVTFHRAFDLVPDPVGSLAILAKAGVARVLTSGGGETAWNGRKTIRTLVAASGGSPAVMAGGGIRANDVKRLVRETGVKEIHARAMAIPGIVEVLERPRRA